MQRRRIRGAISHDGNVTATAEPPTAFTAVTSISGNARCVDSFGLLDSISEVIRRPEGPSCFRGAKASGHADGHPEPEAGGQFIR